MLETKIKILASVYTAILMASLLSLLLLGGFQIQTKPVKGSTMQAIMVDISQVRPKKIHNNLKKTSKPKLKNTKKTTAVKKKAPIKKEIIQKKTKKQTPRIIKKTPKIDTVALNKEKEERKKRKEKRAEIKKKRKELERNRKKEEQYLKELQKQIQSETKHENSRKQQNKKLGFKKGLTQADKLNQLSTAWQLAVIAKVHSQWSKPASKTKNLECYVKVKQIPGGGVVDVTISSPCNANTLEKRSIIAAIKKADPLPYKGFEKVFDRNATFIFNLND